MNNDHKLMIQILAKDMASQVIAGVRGEMNSTGMQAVKLNSMLELASKGWNIFINAARTATRALINLARNGFRFLWDTALAGADLDRLRTVNQVLFNNLPKAIRKSIPSLKEFRAELKDANTTGSNAEKAIGTLLRYPILLERIKTVSRGSKEGLSAFMLKIKDMAAAMGISSSEGIQKFTEAIVAGKLESLDALGVTGNLAAKYRDFAESLNKTSGELTDAQRQQALFNFILKESTKVEGAYEKLKRKGAKGINSFNDAIKSTREEVGLAMQKGFSPLISFLVKLAEKVRDFVTTEKFQEWLANISRIVSKVLRQGFKNMIGVVRSFFDILKERRSDLESIKDSLLDMGGAIQTAFSGGDMKRAGDDLKEATKQTVVDGISTIATKFREFADFLGSPEGQQRIKELKDDLLETADSVKDFVLNMDDLLINFQNAKTDFDEILSDLEDFKFFLDIITGVQFGEWLRDANQGLEDMKESAGPVKPIIEGIEKTVRLLTGVDVISWITGVNDWLKQIVDPAEVVRGLLEDILGLFRHINQELTNTASQAASGGLQSITGGQNLTGGAIQGPQQGSSLSINISGNNIDSPQRVDEMVRRVKSELGKANAFGQF